MKGSFFKRYKLCKLVYCESMSDVRATIARERQLKNWKRGWKLDLIRKDNLEFNDLNVD
ncbi:MAG: hypothetical protein WC178_01225 [Candidatus Paceibacterota bacterium]